MRMLSKRFVCVPCTFLEQANFVYLTLIKIRAYTKHTNTHRRTEKEGEWERHAKHKTAPNEQPNKMNKIRRIHTQKTICIITVYTRKMLVRFTSLWTHSMCFFTLSLSAASEEAPVKLTFVLAHRVQMSLGEYVLSFRSNCISRFIQSNLPNRNEPTNWIDCLSMDVDVHAIKMSPECMFTEHCMNHPNT